jgi:hypothetical protein
MNLCCPSFVIARLDRAIQYSAKPLIELKRQGALDTPLSRGMTISQRFYSGAAPTGGPLTGVPGGGRCRNVIVA